MNKIVKEAVLSNSSFNDDFSEVVHTNSKYANYNSLNLASFFSNENNKVYDIESLKRKEEQFYNLFGVKDFASFRQAFLEKTKDKTKDIEILLKFETKSLDELIQATVDSYTGIFNQKIAIEVNVNNSNIHKFKKNLTNPVKEGDVISLFVGTLDSFSDSGDNKKLKNEIKKLYKNRNYVTIERGEDYEDIQNKLTVNLKKFVTEGIAQQELNIFKVDENNETIRTEINLPSIPNFPWGVKKEDLENDAIKSEVDKAGQEIANFIKLNLCEYNNTELSPFFKTAFDNAWNKNFKNLEDGKIALFFHGTGYNNYKSAVRGNLGEFQADLLIEYIILLSQEGPLDQEIANVIYATIQGDDRDSNQEKLRADVMIHLSKDLGLGVQVKSVSLEQIEREKLNTIRDLETTIHPATLANLLEPSQKTDFSGFIVNYFFNKTVQEKYGALFSDLETKYLPQILGAVMNMAVTDQLADTVTFYFIANRYLVPCSAILSAAKDNNGNLDSEMFQEGKVFIDSSYNGKTDEDYNKILKNTKTRQAAVDKGKKKAKVPIFTKYWRNKSHSWNPTPTNRATYKRLNENRISLRTSFNIKKLNIEQYDLFK